ncbi:MAG: hypothetical protein ABI946_12395 [Chthoniobacterales bacterium]
MMRNLQWQIVLGLTLAFFAGAATGLFGGVWYARRAFDERHGQMMGDRMRERIQHQLDLTPEQMALVDPILNKTAQRLQVIRAETGERVEQVMEDSHREMAALLTPEQQAKLEDLKQRHEHHRQRREERREKRREERRQERAPDAH